MEKEINRELLDEFGITKPSVVTGAIASRDQFIASEEKIRSLSENIDSLKCVEMEGAAVAQACFEHKIPFIVVRVISDSVNV